MRQLCTIKDVQRVFNTLGRFTDEELVEEISEQSDDLYNECGYPLAATITGIAKDDTTSADDFYLRYFLGENRIHHIERLFVGTSTKRELTESTDYEVGKNVGMFKFNTGTVGGSRLDSSDEALIYYVPNLYAKYCALRVAKSLLEQLDINMSGKSSKELEVVCNKLDKQEVLISQRMGVMFSSDYKYFDDKYGVNLKRISQNFDMNKYLWRTDGIED